jgi:hypothetical protein
MRDFAAMRVACACAVVVVLAALAGGTATARVADDRETDAAELVAYINSALNDLHYDEKTTDAAALRHRIVFAAEEATHMRPIIQGVLAGDPKWMGQDTEVKDMANRSSDVIAIAGKFHNNVPTRARISQFSLVRQYFERMLGDAQQIEHPPCTVTSTVTPGTATSEPSVHFSFLCTKDVKTLEIDTEKLTVDTCVSPGNQCQITAGHEVEARAEGGANPILDLIGPFITNGAPDVIKIEGDSGNPTIVDDIM